jgi:hypothetical protein
MRPFKLRQYWDVAPWTLSAGMLRAMDMVELLLDMKPVRSVNVRELPLPPLVVASDAQVEPGELPGGGVLVHDPLGAREARWLQFGEQNLAAWGLSMGLIDSGRQPIALCEAAMLPLAMLAMPELFRGRSVVWYVDNTSAMAAFVTGACTNEHLERIVALFWLCSFRLKCSVWLEWVDSESNWSDGLSRELSRDPFVQEHGFTTSEVKPDITWWNLPLTEVWRTITRLM